MTDNIRPEHYRKGEKDLFEAWYETYSFNEYRAIMQSHAEKYLRRNKVNRVEDLKKAIYTLARLCEKELEHANEKANTTFENEFEKLSKAARRSKEIETAGTYKGKAYVEKINLLKHLQEDDYEYLARDRTGELCAYSKAPLKVYLISWRAIKGNAIRIYKDNFHEIQWTDSEPTKISKLLENYENDGENGNPKKESRSVVIREEIPVEYSSTEFGWWDNALKLHGVMIKNIDKDMVLKIEQGAYELKLVERI